MLLDAATTSLFYSKSLFKSLVRDFVTEDITEDMDFSRIELWPEKFEAGLLQERCGDVIWRIGLQDGTWCCLPLVLEYESRPMHWMAQRVQTCTGRLGMSLVDKGEVIEDSFLPDVVPLVLYTGADEWEDPLDVAELYGEGSWRFRPHNRYYLMDACRMESDVRGAALDESKSPAAQFFRLVREGDASRFRQPVERLLELAHDSEPADTAEDLRKLERVLAQWLTIALQCHAAKGAVFESAGARPGHA